MTKLTPTMERVLAKLRRMSFPADAYQLGCSVATLEADAAYLAGKTWRCPKSPTDAHAHHVVYNAKGVGVCKDCGQRR